MEDNAKPVPWVERALRSEVFLQDKARALEHYQEGIEAGYNTLISDDGVMSSDFNVGTSHEVTTHLASAPRYRTMHTHYHPSESAEIPVPVPSNADLNSHDYATVWGLEQNPEDRQAAAIGKLTDDGLYFLVYQRRKAPGYIEQWLTWRRKEKGRVNEGKRWKTRLFNRYMLNGFDQALKDNGVGWADRKVALYDCRNGINGRTMREIYERGNIDTRRLAVMTAEALEGTGKYIAGVVKSQEDGVLEWLYGAPDRFV